MLHYNIPVLQITGLQEAYVSDSFENFSWQYMKKIKQLLSTAIALSAINSAL